MIAFSTDHMELIRPAAGPRAVSQPALDRWWDAALPPVLRFLEGSLRRHRVPPRMREGVFQETLTVLLDQVRAGLLYEITPRPADERLLRRLDNIVRSITRRRLRVEERLCQLEHEPSLMPNQALATPRSAAHSDEEHRLEEVIAHHQILARRIRELGLPPLQRLIMVLTEAPGGLLAADLALSPRDQVRIPRGLTAAVPLIHSWASRAVHWCMRNPLARRTSLLRAELAWVLWAHPDVEHIDSWTMRERRRAVSWLEQALRQARLVRAERQRRERGAQAARRTRARRTADPASQTARGSHRPDPRSEDPARSADPQLSLFPVLERDRPAPEASRSPLLAVKQRPQPDGVRLPQQTCPVPTTTHPEDP